MTARAHVLFVTYNGLLEPLGLRQGLAYLEPLTDEFRFTVLSFEKTDRASDPNAWSAMEARMAESGIDWRPLAYHSRPSVPATVYDVAAGVMDARRLHRTRPIDGIHARGYIPGAIAWRLSERIGVPWLFDIRGLMADEYVDGGIWTEGSLPWRITRWTERRLLRSATATVTLTQAIRPEIQRRIEASGRTEADPVSAVIPTCVDTGLFRPDPEARSRERARLGWGDELVAVYSGSVGTWYASQPMADYVAALYADRPDLRLLLLLNGSDEGLRRDLDARGVPSFSVTTLNVTPDEVPGYLAAADVGMAFIHPSPSKRASSPTKVAEYLATGLLAVVNRGVGDLDELQDQDAVVVAEGLDAGSLRLAAVETLKRLPIDPAAPHSLARAHFDLLGTGSARYRELYRRMLRPPVSAADVTPGGDQ